MTEPNQRCDTTQSKMRYNAEPNQRCDKTQWTQWTQSPLKELSLPLFPPSSLIFYVVKESGEQG